MKAVIDTNILRVANGQHDDVSPECVSACVERLLTMQDSGTVVIDDAYRILTEYQNKARLDAPKGVGDVFLKWLLRHLNHPGRVEQVSLTETAPDCFDEFPDTELAARFDASDRKFAAVAYAHPDRPPIWQAADCKWLDWWQALHQHGVHIEFLCSDDACRFYQHKFPDRPLPALPGAQP